MDVVAAERRGDVISVQSEFRDKDLIRTVPGASWNGDLRVWDVPLSWASCLTLRGIFGPRLEIGRELASWAWHHRTTVIEPSMKLRSAATAEPVDPRLYPYQNVGVRFMAGLDWALLLDDMGTGKTVQSIFAIKEKGGTLPALIVCPNSMLRTWQKEFGMWWPEARVEVLDGTRVQKLKIIEKVKRGEADVLVANWEALRHHSRQAGYGSVRLQGCKVCDPSETREQRLCARCALGSLAR